jgi:hypothetical protein
MNSHEKRRRAWRHGSFVAVGLVLGLMLAVGVSAAAQTPTPRQTIKQLRLLKDPAGTKSFWKQAARPKRVRGLKVGVNARKLRAVTLNTQRLRATLARAPLERTRTRPLVVSLPAPNCTFHRFALTRSAIMAPGLARRHPEIRTYKGRGITDPTATIHADVSPLGFHASVRSAIAGSWYIDPYYVGRGPSLYASYYGRHAKDTNEPWGRIQSAERAVPTSFEDSAGPTNLLSA